MNLTTKTIASLVVATTFAVIAPGSTRYTSIRHRNESRFDKMMAKHDRKGEIRAEILNISAPELRRSLKDYSFDEITKKAGMTKRTFRLALLAYFRNELKARGWTSSRIDRYVFRQAARTMPLTVIATFLSLNVVR